MKNNQKETLLKIGKTSVLSIQHVFAMMGATILVPIIANMYISIALLAAGIGTVIFYYVTQKKVPVFLGSSFAFLGAFSACLSGMEKGSAAWNEAMGAVAGAVVVTGLVYVVLSVIVRFAGTGFIKKIFPPIVVGPVIIIIGMSLAPKTFLNNIFNSYYNYANFPGENFVATDIAWKIWLVAIFTVIVIVCFAILAKGFFKVIPILCGFIAGYILSLCLGLVNFSSVGDSPWILFADLEHYFGFYQYFRFDGPTILLFAPIAIVTFMEHLGDINANSAVCNKNFVVDPGLHRTILGDGLATMAAGLLGGPCNTTYGENTAVLAITKNYNPRNIFYAACVAIFMGLFGIFGDIIGTIPSAVIGGASLVLYGMIAATGLRALVDAKVDFTDARNMIIVSITLVIGLGLGAVSVAGDLVNTITNYAYPSICKIMVGGVEISSIAIATFVGIILNLVLPKTKKLAPVIAGGVDEDTAKKPAESLLDQQKIDLQKDSTDQSNIDEGSQSSSSQV